MDSNSRPVVPDLSVFPSFLRRLILVVLLGSVGFLALMVLIGILTV